MAGTAHQLPGNADPLEVDEFLQKNLKSWVIKLPVTANRSWWHFGQRGLLMTKRSWVHYHLTSGKGLIPSNHFIQDIPILSIVICQFIHRKMALQKSGLRGHVAVIIEKVSEMQNLKNCPHFKAAEQCRSAKLESRFLKQESRKAKRSKGFELTTLGIHSKLLKSFSPLSL